MAKFTETSVLPEPKLPRNIVVLFSLKITKYVFNKDKKKINIKIAWQWTEFF